MNMKFVPFFIYLLSVVACAPRDKQVPDNKPQVISDSAALCEECRVCAGQFYEADELDSALFWYTRATEYDPQSPQAWHGKASTLSRMLRHDEAQVAYDEALRLKPDYVLAIWHRACDYSVNLHREEALATLKHAVELDPSVKQNAKEDPCFQWLWKDDDFLKVVK